LTNPDYNQLDSQSNQFWKFQGFSRVYSVPVVPYMVLWWHLCCDINGLKKRIPCEPLLPKKCSPSWHWEHFHKGAHASSTHFKAYCIYHTKYLLELLEGAEKATFDAGTIGTMRTKDVLVPEGVGYMCLHVKHILI